MLTRHPALLLLCAALAVTFGVVLVYLRALCRFALVASILRKEVLHRSSVKEIRPLAGSYFRWLLGALLLMGVLLAAGAFVGMHYLRITDRASLPASFLLALLLLGEGFVGLLAGLAISMTDDLVVPIIYAERLAMFAAWRRLLAKIRTEAGAFTLFVFLRVVVSVGVGIAVLFFLFPALVTVFSGAILIAVPVVTALQFVGLTWVWTPVTSILTGAALLLLMALLLVLLSVAGMPGLVFLQTFGLRFMTPRVPALARLWQEHTLQRQPE